MNTGHDGSFGTLHANTAAETVTRLINPPMNVPSIMLGGLDLIIVQARLHENGKTARKIIEVAEVAGMEGNKPRLNAIWKYDPVKCKIEETGTHQELLDVDGLYAAMWRRQSRGFLKKN